jgi:alcohol dehydrogenase class IV
MERVRHKIEEVIQKQKRLQEQSQAKTASSSTKDKSQYIIALGGGCCRDHNSCHRLVGEVNRDDRS